MADTKFQYVRSPSGSLSGASMAQQTEDALTSISYTAETAKQIVTDAQSNIESALLSAQVAQAQSETNLKEMRLIAQELSGLNIPAQDGHIGEFVGTNGTKLVWQNGMRYQGEVATKNDLPIEPTLTHGTLVGGDLPTTTLDELKTITNGGFNITVEGELKEYAGLNFSTCSSLADAVAVINSAISDWGSCEYIETPVTVEVKTNLYPWITQDGSKRVYAITIALEEDSKLYNADGTEYTGTDFVITEVASESEDEDPTYKVTYNGADCYLSPSAVLTLIDYEQDTLRQYVLTTTATGTSATIGLALSPSLQTTQDASSVLQLSSGTATNGASIGNTKSDVYLVGGEAIYFWDGTQWLNISVKETYVTTITLSANTPQGTAITIPDKTYIVGANSLAISYNGVKCYKDKNFSEVGNSGASSSTFKLLFNAVAGDEIEVTIY